MRHQLLGEGVLRVSKNVKHLTGLHHLAAGHYRHAIANRFDHVHLVSDQHDRDPQLLVDLLEQRQNRGRGFEI